MDHLVEALNRSLEHEGGFSNNADDSGGATNWGVTEALARRHLYTGDMRDLPRGTAIMIHTHEFWLPLHCGDIASLSPRLAYKLFDFGMHTGTVRAAKSLQRMLNVLNRQEKDYPDVEVDGDVGRQTLGALTAFLKFRGAEGELVLWRGLNCLQGAFYVELGEAREKDETFMFGWLLKRVQ